MAWLFLLGRRKEGGVQHPRNPLLLSPPPKSEVGAVEAPGCDPGSGMGRTGTALLIPVQFAALARAIRKLEGPWDGIPGCPPLNLRVLLQGCSSPCRFEGSRAPE